MTNKLSYSSEGREALLKGVKELAAAVKVTLGARGRTVAIGNVYGNTPHLTKDGVTVAKSIRLPNIENDMGAVMVKDAAIRTAETAGDGTTTACILAESIMEQGVAALGAGANPMDLKRGIDKAVTEVVSYIKSVAKKVDSSHADIKKIATISANNDEEIGSLIATAMKQVGNYGEIDTEDGNTYETTVEQLPGIGIERGFLSRHFINVPEKQTCTLINPYILYVDKKLSFVREIMPLLQMVSEEKRSLLIVSDDLSDEALQTVVMNKNRGALLVCAIKCPEFGVRRKIVMDDIATICGGIFITEDMGVKLDKTPKETLFKKLGQAEKITITKDKTVIIGGKGDKEAVAGLIESIKVQLSETQDENEKPFLRTRLAKLTNGVATLRIGGVTEMEIKEKKDRIDDALCATRSAVEEGVVAGGGVTYLNAIRKLLVFTEKNKDVMEGINIVKKAIAAPFRQMLTNAGKSEAEIDFTYESIMAKETKYGVGYNGKTEIIENLLDAGVLDPAKVARVALENAASIAGTFLTTEAVISPIM